MVYIFTYFQARKYIESLPHMPQQDLKAVFRGANPLGKKVRLTQIKFFTNIGTHAFLEFLAV